MLVKEIDLECRSSFVGGSGDELLSIANSIDQVDSKITNGLVLVGGAVVIANPIVGAGIIASALIPAVGGMLSKAGLRWSGEKLNNIKLSNEIEKAKQGVLKQFQDADTICLSNSILHELELALATSRAEHDPNFFNFNSAIFEGLVNERYIYLSGRAIVDVYSEVRSEESLHQKASIQQEDLEWFSKLDNIVSSYETVMSSPDMNRWHRSREQLKQRLILYGDLALQAKLFEVHQSILALSPMTMRRNILESDRYEINRLMFSLLPELNDKYLAVPIEKESEAIEANRKSPFELFKSSFLTLGNKLELLSTQAYEKDGKELRQLSLYLYEKYPS